MLDAINDLLATFQSSPVPKDGRYRQRNWGQQCTACFNPRPSRRTGATPLHWRKPRRIFVFQSSPVPKDGRYVYTVAPRT
ncbi:MAG: hypothetical protein NTX84_13780, partial [Nitrospirae bacterium]|nr:hypothetical protein [Nitrospirota bacterium]